jgi:serine phosphatase RsbU (regulator of sigma subunit)
MRRDTITYPDGTAQGKQLTIPVYREIAYIDRNGQEKVRVTDGKIVPPSELRNVSDPANTTYKSETYFADTKALPRDGVYVSRVTAWHSTVPNEPNYQAGACNATGDHYTTYEGIIRFTAPVYDPQGQFDGIVMLALDHRLIMENVVHIIPSSEVQSVPWPDYEKGNYAYIWDDEGYLIAHPRINGTRGVDANGQLVAQWPANIKAEDQCRYLFNMTIGAAPAPKMYQDTLKGLTNIEFNVNRAGTRKANIYTPIFFNYGVYAKTGIFGGLVIGASVDEFHKAANEVRASLDAEQGRFQTNILIIALAAIFLLGVIGVLISRSITRPVSRLNLAARRVEEGKEDLTVLDAVVSRNIRDEVSDLAEVFKQMAGTVQERERELKISRDQLEEYNIKLEDLVLQRTNQLQQANQEITALNERLRADNLRLKAEIEITRQLQQMILPKDQELNQIVGLEISGFMLPADEVGGDYYDVLQENGRVKIGIGDVTGHGLESGVLMIMVQTAVRTLLAANEIDPARYLGVLNRAIYENVQRMRSDKNLTLSLLDYEDGKIRLSGQHEETIIVRENGSLELIDTIDLGFPIGLEADITGFVSEVNLHLNPGDIIVLYTDGIPEAENEQGVQYGLERLCQVIQANHHLTAPELKKVIIDDLIGFIGKQRVYDDITLLVLKQKEVAQPCEATLLN